MQHAECFHCGYPIPFDPDVGSVIKNCPRCGFEMHIHVREKTNVNKPKVEQNEMPK